MVNIRGTGGPPLTCGAGQLFAALEWGPGLILCLQEALDGPPVMKLEKREIIKMDLV